MASKTAKRRAAKRRKPTLPPLGSEAARPRSGLVRDPVTLVEVDPMGRATETDERSQHGDIGPTTVFDGKRRLTVRATRTTIDALEASGLITPAEAAAGVDFADHFQRGALDPLGSSLGRDEVRGGDSKVGHITEAARASRAVVEDVVDMLGGYESRGARAILDVCGLSMSIREHVAKQRAIEGTGRYQIDMARGIIPLSLAIMARRLRLNNDRKKSA